MICSLVDEAERAATAFETTELGQQAGMLVRIKDTTY
jgi:hypothetical protein